MTIYITVADVDSYIGNSDWAIKDTPERCVSLANLWLSSKNLPVIDPAPQEWKDAGCEIAIEIGKGKIYTDKQTGLLSKSVSADTVSVSKTYTSNATSYTRGELIANDLLKPWLISYGSVQFIKKV